MKCKQQRKKQKERSKLIGAFVSKLKELNPERTFLQEKEEIYKETTTIYADTDELWNINLPENWEVILGKDEKEIAFWGFIQLKKEKCFVEIQSTPIRFN